jgi:hypothetical protein
MTMNDYLIKLPYAGYALNEANPKIAKIAQNFKLKTLDTKPFSGLPDVLKFHFQAFFEPKDKIQRDSRGYLRIWTKKSLIKYLLASSDWALADFITMNMPKSINLDLLANTNLESYTQILINADPYRRMERNRNRNLKRISAGKTHWDGQKVVHLEPRKNVVVSKKATVVTSVSNPVQAMLTQNAQNKQRNQAVSQLLKQYKRLNKGKKLSRKQVAHLEKLNGGPLMEAHATLTQTLFNKFTKLPTSIVPQKVEDGVEDFLFATTLIVGVSNGRSRVVGFMNAIMQAIIHWKVDIAPFFTDCG